MFDYVLLLLLLFDRTIQASLALSVVSVVAWRGVASRAFFIAFVVGIVVDVLWIFPLGQTSLLLLVWALVLLLVRQRFGASTWWLLFSLVLVGEVMSMWYFEHAFSVFGLLIQLLVVFVLRWLMQLSAGVEGVYLKS